MEIQQDFQLFKNAAALRRDGALLLEAAGGVGGSGGRVVFSLQEIPLRRRFQTSNGNFLRREKNELVVLWSPDQTGILKIPVCNTVTTSNKDVFFWAQVQNDLLLFDDAKHLALAGAVVTEQVSGRQLEIRALADLPLGTKYFSEHGNVIQRLSANEILLGDKMLYVNAPPSSDDSFSTTTTSDSAPSSDDECSRSSLDGFIVSETKLSKDMSPEGEEPVRRDSLEEKTKHLFGDEPLVAAPPPSHDELVHAVPPTHPLFPRVTAFALSGSGYHLDAVRFTYTYAGGVEGNSVLRWERSDDGMQTFLPIQGAKSTTYMPTLEDLGSYIRAALTPMRADGVTGAITFTGCVRIRLDPEVAAEVESNLSLSTVLFKVLMRNGKEFQKRAVLLTPHKIKLRKRRQTQAKSFYGHNVMVAPSVENDCHFSLGLSKDEYYSFVAPSAYTRDIIVLTIQMINARSIVQSS